MIRYCETEDDRGWDYCCRPEHRCGYSDGFRSTQLFFVDFSGKPQSLWKIIINNIKHNDDAATRGASLEKQVSTSGVHVMQKELELGTGAAT